MRDETMTKTELVILDFDGTLVDTRDDIVAGVREALADLHQPAPPDPVIAGHIGRGVEHLAASCLPPDRQDLLQGMLERFRSRYGACFDRTSAPYPGVVHGLTLLRNNDRQLAVASNKPQYYIDRLLDRFYLRPFFRSVIGGDRMERKKPDPWSVKRICARCAVPPGASLMVGDMRYDIETGINAGMETCGVLYGYGSEDELRRAGAHHLVSDFPALIDLLE